MEAEACSADSWLPRCVVMEQPGSDKLGKDLMPSLQDAHYHIEVSFFVFFF